MRQLPLRVLVACAIVALVGVGACNREEERAGRGGGQPERPTPEGPNVVVITTDDQSNHSWRRNVMPNTFELVVDRGTRFRSALAAPPLCCPSRAGFLTGQYPHNNGVLANEPGYPDLRIPKSILPVWLNDAGYTTGFVGKYLNGTSTALDGEPPPGWDSYFQIDDLSYRNAAAVDNGERVKLGHAYTPMVLNGEAEDFIARESGSRPFFLWLAQTAPHAHSDKDGTCKGKAPQPLPGDLADSQNVPLPHSASFNERDVSDKPREIAALPPLSKEEERVTEKLYRCTVGALQEVDRGVEDIVQVLEKEGEIEDTVILFHSDNGLFFGEHRIRSGKGRAYESALRVPMAMVLPPQTQGKPLPFVREIVSNVDIAPTLLDLTGVEPCVERTGCRKLDGRSLVGLMNGDRRAWARDRGILVEQANDGCEYAAIRTANWLYNENLEGAPGECELVSTELYDLRRDPDQLENLLADPRPGARPPELLRMLDDRRMAEKLFRRLAELRDCAGTVGKNACE